jgi:hypothetical protein
MKISDLAHTISGLLTRRIKFPKRRPPKIGLRWKRQLIAERVWETKRSKGWKKIDSAINHVAEEFKLSPSTVWKCWSDFGNPAGYELKLEKLQYDAMITEAYDLANEARREAAIESLKETKGNREFTDEEIETAANELVEWAPDYDYD